MKTYDEAIDRLRLGALGCLLKAQITRPNELVQCRRWAELSEDCETERMQLDAASIYLIHETVIINACGATAPSASDQYDRRQA